MSETAVLPGFFGKLPGRGDFVTRRLPRSFLDGWDAWLQAGIAESRNALGESWLESYLSSPVWRFVLAAEACGPDAWAGVLMPSVDRVGRYFPLTIAVPLPGNGNAASAAAANAQWFDGAEDLVLAALDEDEDFDLDGYEERVAGLGGCAAPRSAAPPAETGGSSEGVQIPLGGQAVEAGLLHLLDGLLARHVGRYSLWWSAGSEQVEPSLLVCAGLPPASGFAGLLVGQWQEWSWLAWPHPPSGEVPAAEDEGEA